MSGPLNIREVIDQAIKENQLGERILMGFALLFVGLGAFVLVWGVVTDSFVGYAGVAESVLFVPAVLLVMKIRKENLALRMLEIPLRKAKTTEEACRELITFFSSAHETKGRRQNPPSDEN